MLIIARKQGEKIVIGDDTVITLLDIRENQVRIGIEAPRHIGVHRQEVYDKIRRANLASSGIDVSHVMAAAALLQPGSREKEQPCR